MKVYEMEEAFATLEAMLESGEIDEDVYNDTLESLPIEETAVWMAKIRRNTEADIKALDDEIKRLKDRKERLKHAKERESDTLLRLCHLKGGSIKSALFTISPRKSTAVVITDEKAIPEAFKSREVTIKIDKNALKDYIKAGMEVDGAELVQNETVTIR